MQLRGILQILPNLQPVAMTEPSSCGIYLASDLLFIIYDSAFLLIEPLEGYSLKIEWSKMAVWSKMTQDISDTITWYRIIYEIFLKHWS